MITVDHESQAVKYISPTAVLYVFSQTTGEYYVCTHVGKNSRPHPSPLGDSGSPILDLSSHSDSEVIKWMGRDKVTIRGKSKRMGIYVSIIQRIPKEQIKRV